MTDESYYRADAKDLPYRFAPCLLTGEVFIIAIGHGMGVSWYFENYLSFRRFLEEGIKTDALIQTGVLKEIEDILKGKQES